MKILVIDDSKVVLKQFESFALKIRDGNDGAHGWIPLGWNLVALR